MYIKCQLCLKYILTLCAIFRTAILGAACLIMVCCEEGIVDQGTRKTMNLAIREVPRQIPIAGQFIEAFPESYVSLSHFNHPSEPKIWSGSAALHGRYIVSLHIPLALTFDGLEPITVQKEREPLQILINEVTALRLLADGRKVISYGRQVELTVDDLRRALAGRDFSPFVDGDAHAEPTQEVLKTLEGQGARWKRLIQQE